MKTKEFITFGDLEKIELSELQEETPIYAITSNSSCTCAS